MDKGRRSRLRGRLKALSKDDLVSLAESGELSVEGLKKDSILERLLNLLVPDEGGDGIAEKGWRLLRLFWQEKASLMVVQSKIEESYGGVTAVCELLAWQLGLPREQVEDRKRGRAEILAQISSTFVGAYGQVEDLESDLRDAGLLENVPNSLNEAVEKLQVVKLPKFVENLSVATVTVVVHDATSKRGRNPRVACYVGLYIPNVSLWHG